MKSSTSKLGERPMDLRDCLERVIRETGAIQPYKSFADECADRAMWLLGAAIAIRFVTDGNPVELVNDDIKVLLSEQAGLVTPMTMTRQ